MSIPCYKICSLTYVINAEKHTHANFDNRKDMLIVHVCLVYFKKIHDTGEYAENCIENVQPESEFTNRILERSRDGSARPTYPLSKSLNRSRLDGLYNFPTDDCRRGAINALGVSNSSYRYSNRPAEFIFCAKSLPYRRQVICGEVCATATFISFFTNTILEAVVVLW